MRLRSMVAAVVVSLGSLAVGAGHAGAAPPAEEPSVSWVHAAWDAGDGTPASAVQVLEGMVDLGAGPEPFRYVSVVIPTVDGASQINCSGATSLDVRISLRRATVAGNVICPDGRSLDLDLRWTGIDPPKGGGPRSYGEVAATATGTISDGTVNFVPGPSTSATIGRQLVG